MSNDIPHKVRVAVRNRSNGICERCLSRPAREKAHRIPRNMRWHIPSGIADLCPGCHHFCTTNPMIAKAQGWNLPANSRITKEDLQVIPARTRNGWVQFTEGIDERGDLVSRTQPLREAFALEIMTSFNLLEEVPA